MKKIGLHTKFAVLFVAVIVVLLIITTLFSSGIQQKQTEREMLETAQVLAHEMDATWVFMEKMQSQFVRRADGTYNVYCVVAAKAISKIFSTDNNYIIHYTNLNTRKIADYPDDFETEAMKALLGDPSLESYYGIESADDGKTVFRYVEPLFITESCLECHGSPKGELDMMGFEKEGLNVGDIAGAVSIIMPADTYMENVRATIIQETVIFGSVLLFGLLTIFFAISKLVTSPLRKLEKAANQVKDGDFKIDMLKIGDKDEIQDLSSHFQSMARQLDSLYSGLENEVADRTSQLEKANLFLEEANTLLEKQRAELKEKNELLEIENKYQTDFFAIMTHELRTPLTSILAFAQIWAESNEPRNAKEAKIMNEMRINSQILLTKVNNILDMAKVEAGKVEILREPIDIADLLNNVKWTLNFIAEKSEVEIKVRIGSELPVVNIDNEKTSRMVENLVINAIKYTQPGGLVDIFAAYDKADAMLKITVSDNGVGIPAADLPTIFDRFVQGKERKDHASGGSGLGLAVVRELAELHGGNIEVASIYEQGSTFTLSIKAEIS